MTIGDEKVVAWLDDAGDVWTDKETALEWCKDGIEPAGLIKHSAYAELAAERDGLLSDIVKLAPILVEWCGKVSDERQARVAAESQLAELRGLLGRWERRAKAYAEDQPNQSAVSMMNGEWFSAAAEVSERFTAELRSALAAADGATTGETK